MSRTADAQQFLDRAGAPQIEHPGGTLYEHLNRVAQTLREWGNDEDIQLAGLCHAAYGTDGFDRSLLDLSERGRLMSLIGWRAESLVYLYASCDRAATYRHLPSLRDRFTGATYRLEVRDVRAFAEITAANEMDVGQVWPYFQPFDGYLSEPARNAVRNSEPGRQPNPAPAAVTVTHLDHLVLTVADIARSLDFYARVLGMRPVEFGAGRHALAFGNSKINLHRAGEELTPHASRPLPGSADLCLLTDTPIAAVIAHLARSGVPVELGPVPRTGALGPLESVYLRDPDGNLIEISNRA